MTARLKVVASNHSVHYLSLPPGVDVVEAAHLLTGGIPTGDTPKWTPGAWLDTSEGIRIRADKVEQVFVEDDAAEAASEALNRFGRLGRKAAVLAVTGMLTGVPSQAAQDAVRSILPGEKPGTPIILIHEQRGPQGQQEEESSEADQGFPDLFDSLRSDLDSDETRRASATATIASLAELVGLGDLDVENDPEVALEVIEQIVRGSG